MGLWVVMIMAMELLLEVGKAILVLRSQ